MENASNLAYLFLLCHVNMGSGFQGAANFPIITHHINVSDPRSDSLHIFLSWMSKQKVNFADYINRRVCCFQEVPY